jgi:hypothetical protein
LSLQVAIVEAELKETGRWADETKCPFCKTDCRTLKGVFTHAMKCLALPFNCPHADCGKIVKAHPLPGASTRTLYGVSRRLLHHGTTECTHMVRADPASASEEKIPLCQWQGRRRYEEAYKAQAKYLPALFKTKWAKETKFSKQLSLLLPPPTNGSSLTDQEDMMQGEVTRWLRATAEMAAMYDSLAVKPPLRVPPNPAYVGQDEGKAESDDDFEVIDLGGPPRSSGAAVAAGASSSSSSGAAAASSSSSSAVSPAAAALAAAAGLASPQYSPTSPAYSPTSPHYEATGPAYSPTEPNYRPGSPAYSPAEASYDINSPDYSPIVD